MIHSTVLLGQFPHLTDPDVETREQDLRFCRSVVDGLQLNVKMTQSIRESILQQKFGIETEMYKKFASNWDEARLNGNKMIADLREKRENGQLNEYEEASYWNQAHNRRVEDNSELTESEVDGLCYTMLTASVDTTAGTTAWHVLHTALNPDFQDKMYEEVKRIADECGGVFTEDSFSAGNAPYLHGLSRESHRLTTRKRREDRAVLFFCLS